MAHDEAKAILPCDQLPRSLLGCRTIPEALEALTLLEEMRAEEGNSITIFCDNPDFGGDNAGVDASWDYGEMPERFSGDTVLECLRNAHAAWKVKSNG